MPFTLHSQFSSNLNSKRKEQFFGTGVALLGLWEKSYRTRSNMSVRSTEPRQFQQALDQLEEEMWALRMSLLSVRRKRK